jgi:hypothetical protein
MSPTVVKVDASRVVTLSAFDAASAEAAQNDVEVKCMSPK